MRKKLIYIFTCSFWLIVLTVSAQQTAVIFGKVTNAGKQGIINANITISGLPGGTTTDKNGEFEFQVPSGKKIVLTITYIGFVTDTIDLLLQPGERKEIHLTLAAASTSLPAIDVSGRQIRTSTFNRIDIKEITLIPSANAGIEDLIKTMPGVSSHNELSSTYSVRGGNYDENLVFVDDIEVYRPFLIRSGQQEGLSFLNPDLVSSIMFSAGGFDARFGDKMSSVLDIKYKRPTSFAGSFDISLLGANAHLEGVIAKKLTFLVGARYKSNSYFLKGLDTKGDYKPKFFDLQALLEKELNRKVDIVSEKAIKEQLKDIILKEVKYV